MQVRRTAKSLNDGHAAATRVRHTVCAGPATKVPFDGTVEDARDAAAQGVVPGEQVAEPVRDGQNPLPNVDVRQHVVHQMRGAPAMRRPPQRGENPRPLHEKATRRSVVQSPQRNRANPPAKNPQRRNARDSSSTNRGRPPPRVPPPRHGTSRNGRARRCRAPTTPGRVACSRRAARFNGNAGGVPRRCPLVWPPTRPSDAASAQDLRTGQPEVRNRTCGAPLVRED
jgi:hypothetical protein